MKPAIHICGLIFVIGSWIFTSCSNTRYLVDEQMLYTGKTRVILSYEKFKFSKAKQAIEEVTSFKPNNSLAGKRVLPPGGLWLYNYRKPKNNKSPGWFYRSFAKEPVLISVVNPEMRCRKLESELFSLGFFHASVWASVDTSLRNPRKAGITYYIRPDLPFRYNEIYFPPPADEVDSIINKYRDGLAFKSEDLFDLETVKAETRKISNGLQEAGYFYFSPAHIKWSADTTRVPYRMDMKIRKDIESFSDAGQKFAIRDISVRISGQDSSAYDTVSVDGVRILSQSNYVKPGVVSRAVYFRRGDIYSTTRYQQTMAHISNYGIFRYMNLQFTPVSDSLLNQLDLFIDLTTMKDINLDLEGNVVTKSTGFSGPGFVATLAHGNLARGANKLQLKLNGGFEWQWGNSSTTKLGTMSYNVGLSTTLVFPRILKPFNLFNTNRFSLPQTSITQGFEFLNKIQYYRMRSVNLGLGYQWKRSKKITLVYSPLFMNSITLMETTPEFDSIMDANPYIRKSFEEQFIAGMKYDFTFDNSLTMRPNCFYFQGGVSTSGNLFDIIKTASSGSDERPYTVIGNVYSQFLKITTDFRYYRNFRNQSLAFRLYSGIGYSYGNSVVMPYVEQFYSGGSNSIRAFIARSLGPGSLKSDESAEIIDQTGDIKLEGNAEYRFRMTKVMHGAFFIDAGNVWLLNPDENRPGAEFHFNTFVNQLAVGTGFGFRFDFGFFVMRTDFGIPLRRTYATDDSNWIKNKEDIFDGMVFNLAIGYPF